MAVRRIRLVGFRALANQQLVLAPSLNLIVGENASGKTSLLEALDVMSRGRSFRSVQLTDIATWRGDGRWAIDLDQGEDQDIQRLKGRFQKGSFECRLHGDVVNREHMAKIFPSLILGPDLHRLMDDGPKVRRSLLDWALFHVEQSFVQHWRRYQQALRQRNAAIRRHEPLRQIHAWNEALLAEGDSITEYREQLVAALKPRFIEQVSGMSLLPDVELIYRRGWSKELSFGAALTKADDRAQSLLPTPVGPHRADLDLLATDGRAQTTLSRGQQKVFLICLAVALATVVHERMGRWPLLAIDDWQAELSEQSSSAVMALLQQYRGQRVISGFAPPTVPLGPDARVFHVEQGQFAEC